MRKALRIIAVSAGIVSVLSTVILGFIYLEDILNHIKKAKVKISEKIRNRREEEEEDYFEEIEEE